MKGIIGKLFTDRQRVLSGCPLFFDVLFKSSTEGLMFPSNSSWGRMLRWEHRKTICGIKISLKQSFCTVCIDDENFEECSGGQDTVFRNELCELMMGTQGFLYCKQSSCW